MRAASFMPHLHMIRKLSEFVLNLFKSSHLHTCNMSLQLSSPFSLATTWVHLFLRVPRLFVGVCLKIGEPKKSWFSCSFRRLFPTPQKGTHKEKTTLGEVWSVYFSREHVLGCFFSGTQGHQPFMWSSRDKPIWERLGLGLDMVGR